jgi:hypothetical protein
MSMSIHDEIAEYNVRLGTTVSQCTAYTASPAIKPLINYFD